MKDKPKQDAHIHDCGSIVQIIPISDEAKQWVDDNCETEGWQWMGPALCMDYRYAGPIVDGMQESGLSVA